MPACGRDGVRASDSTASKSLEAMKETHVCGKMGV
jgi:hypothetical protein